MRPIAERLPRILSTFSVVVLMAAGFGYAVTSRRETRSETETSADEERKASPVKAGDGVQDATADAWVDCVNVLHVVSLRGVAAANAYRFGEDASSVRTTARIADLDPTTLRAFCDWEACIQANGYAHVCTVQDGGWESCRVCDSSADCQGGALSGDDCVAHASDLGRAQCHVGLREECLLQRAILELPDVDASYACRASELTCAGMLPGDLTTPELDARQETIQAMYQELYGEVIAADGPDSAITQAWQALLEPLGEWPVDDAGDASDAD